MRLTKVRIKNFRLLKEIELAFNEKSTVVVGRNNSGKTSLAEIFKRLLAEKIKFELEDFSLGCHEKFWTAYEAAKTKPGDSELLKQIPFIEVGLVAEYDKSATILGPISDFIVDLNPACNEVLVTFRYELKPSALVEFLAEAQRPAGAAERTAFFKALKQRIPECFAGVVFAIDPGDATNRKSVEIVQLRSLMRAGFIHAQRGLDDQTDRENVVLGKILEILFKTAKSANASKDDQTTVQKLESAVQGVQSDIDTEFSDQLDKLLPAFQVFGYPRLPDPKLRTETLLNVEGLLTGHTRIRYSGINGIHLPEGYNGLGTRNLIFILLKLLEFFKSHQTAETTGINIVFIEEPEAHLHPQMQEVFISKLSELAREFAERFSGGKVWPVQFVVTTHSSHLANKVPFRNMRYLLSVADGTAGISQTKVKDLGQGFSGDLKHDEAFLHQYMTLTCCDLLFADKAILIEGTCERILLPKLIARAETGLTTECKLSSQYISVLEVDGAYAHRFFKLLEFLELKALVITDLDSIDSKKDRTKCLVSQGDATSNACINTWFGGAAFADICKKSAPEKVTGARRIAFQIPEAAGEPTGRSFEEALVLANAAKFKVTGANAAEREVSADKIAKDDLPKKTELALKLAIEDEAWAIPAYINEGLLWLVEEEIAAAAAAEATAKTAKETSKSEVTKAPAAFEAPEAKVAAAPAPAKIATPESVARIVKKKPL